MSKQKLLSGDALSDVAGEKKPKRDNWYDARCRKFTSCLRSFMLPGYGMFSEAFFLLSFDNLKKGIFPVSYPDCWNSNSTLNINCEHQVAKDSIPYTTIGGFIIGLLVISVFGDKFGRRAGSILTSVIMLVGAILMACSYAPTVEGQFIMFTIALAIFGVGIGGEYPLASSSAAERASTTSTRGRTVLLTYSMQGLGSWVYTCSLIVLLYITGAGWSTKNEDYNITRLNRIWRYIFGAGAAGLFILVIGRAVYLNESKPYAKGQKKREKNPGFYSALGHFWHRLFGTAANWFVWNITFYGNKLFLGAFIKDIVGDNVTPIQLYIFVLINSTVALAGYYASAYTIDKMGRWNMQFMGFFVMFILYLVCGIAYEPLSKQAVVFQIIYSVSTFFGQWGPNATCWLLSSEIFPTEIRATAHGLSATFGQLGTLLAGILFGFGFLGGHPQYVFVISGIASFFGIVVTTVFTPDTTEVSLAELDKYWDKVKQKDAYDGPVVYRKYRSWWETMWNLTSFTQAEHFYSDYEEEYYEDE